MTTYALTQRHAAMFLKNNLNMNDFVNKQPITLKSVQL